MEAMAILAVFLLVVGIQSLVKPEWDAKVERWLRTRLSHNEPEEIKLDDSWYALNIAFGIISTAIGFLLFLSVII